MKLEGVVLGLSALLVAVSAIVPDGSRRERVHGRRQSVQHQNFDEWLMHVMAPGTTELSQSEAPSAQAPGEAATENTDVRTGDAASSQDILGYFRDVPRQHWSCCMLGKLAGDKGFHCHAGFYAARLQSRNQNRAHNRRMPLMHGRERVHDWGADIMRTFQRCVLEHSAEFHKCCYAATVERREIRRWRHFREPVVSTRN